MWCDRQGEEEPRLGDGRQGVSGSWDGWNGQSIRRCELCASCVPRLIELGEMRECLALPSCASSIPGPSLMSGLPQNIESQAEEAVYTERLRLLLLPAADGAQGIAALVTGPDSSAVAVSLNAMSPSDIVCLTDAPCTLPAWQ